MASIIPLRDKAEHDLTTKLGAVFLSFVPIVSAAIVQFGNPKAIPEFFWNSLRAEIDRNLEAAVLLIILAADEWELKDLTTEDVEAFPKTTAGEYATAAAKIATSSSEQSIGKSREELQRAWVESFEAAENIEDETGGELKVPVSEIAGNAVSAVFGEPNNITLAERIAAHAAVQGVSVGQIGASKAELVSRSDRPEKNRVETIWRIHPEEAKSGMSCPICTPLDGQPERIWGRQFPDGPPTPHPHCHCTLENQVVVT